MKVICTQPHDAERDKLAGELSGLRADVKSLKSERDETAERNKLRDQIAELKREKATLTEDNNRKIRETEHKTGLLKVRQEHEVANARRETELSVREENLKADKRRFADEMEFQRKHLQGEVDRIDGVLKAILERLPVIDVALSGGAAPPLLLGAFVPHQEGRRLMAVGDYCINSGITTTGSGTNTWMSSGTTWVSPMTVTVDGGGGGYTAPAPTPKTALEWLDDEIEATCRLARQAG